MTEFLKAFALIFVAEMGDKTQIMAMAFATQYAIKSILSGVFLGSFLNHGIAILLGSLFLTKLPMGLIQLLAGAVFIAFGLQSLNIEGDSDEEKSKAKHGAVLTVAMAFFIGELGDKTQLTAMTLGTESMYPFLTLMGTSLGMVSVSLFGIFIGAKLGGAHSGTLHQSHCIYCVYRFWISQNTPIRIRDRKHRMACFYWHSFINGVKGLGI